jgi:hypothetical protein
VYAGGRRLTVDDDVAFVPSVRWLMQDDAERVSAGAVPPNPAVGRTPEEIYEVLHADDTEWREHFWLLQWGPTLDNVLFYAYVEADELVIVFAFCRDQHPGPEEVGRPYIARVGRDRFARDLAAAAAALGGHA